MLGRVPFSVTSLASPATNRSWRRKHVLATRTWDGSDLQPQPLQPGEEGDLLPCPDSQALGSQGLLLQNKFLLSFRGHGAPTLRGQLRPTGPQSYWEAHGQELERHPLRKKAGLFQEHKEQPLGWDRLCMLMARCWESMALSWGKGGGGRGRLPALSQPWLGPRQVAAVHYSPSREGPGQGANPQVAQPSPRPCRVTCAHHTETQASICCRQHTV